jgi:LPXTG-site transpeptidase (sortase) family protein
VHPGAYARPVRAQVARAPRPARRRGLWTLRVTLLLLVAMLAVGLSTPSALMPALARTTAQADAAAPGPGERQASGPLIPGAERLPRPGRPERLVIQSVGIDTPVLPVEPVPSRGRLIWQTADHAAGHHAGSALPGENGTVVLSGHLNTPLSGQGAVFRALPDVRVGDVIEVYTSDRVYRYQVRELRLVQPEETDAVESSGAPMIALITCFPDWTFEERLVVLGTLMSGAGS